MALGSWMGLYISVVDELMAMRREQELLLLMAIARHADYLGFCWPGRSRLMALRHAGEKKHNERMTWLVERNYVRVVETWDYRRRQWQQDYQISPCVIYIREEFQDYCERVFNGDLERDYTLENGLYQNFSSLKDSQPESLPESENRRIQPAPGTSRRTSNHNQLSTRATKTEGRNASTMRSAQTEQTENAKRTEKDNPQAGGAPIDLETLITDRELLIKAIMHVASTTEHQAADVADTYPIDQTMHWLRNTNLRRQKGELKKPGGYFFKMLRMHGTPIDQAMPNGQTYQDWETDQSEDMEP